MTTKGKEPIVPLDDLDFGMDFVDPEVVSQDWEKKFNELKEMITPLLKNLMRNPDKDIHWPGRDKRIQEFLDKMNNL